MTARSSGSSGNMTLPRVLLPRMTNGPTRRSRHAPRHQPSRAELRRAEQILKKLTPSPDAYREYRAQVDDYRTLARVVIQLQHPRIITGFRMRRSKLFDDRQYLTAFVLDEWLHEIAPSCDAICSVGSDLQAHPDMGVRPPPLVFIPDSKRGARGDAHRSVVEHELVHVNQAIIGFFPEPALEPRASALIDFFVCLTTAEFEASLVQVTRWTDTVPAEADVTLEHWCLVKGYSQALERAVLMLADQSFSAREAREFLDTLHSSLPDLLGQVGVDEELASWFATRTSVHLFIAVQSVAAHFPHVLDSRGFRAAVRWLESGLPFPLG